MARPLSRVTINEWAGLASNRGPFARKPGEASVLTNMRCDAPGVLRVRGGHAKLQTYGTDPEGEVIAIVNYDSPKVIDNCVVWQVGGSVYYGRSPTV